VEDGHLSLPHHIDIHGNLHITLAISTRRRFTVKIPEDGKKGYVYIRRERLKHAARLSIYGSGRQRELAAEFVEYILQRAKEKGEEVYEKVKDIIEESKARDSLKLKGLEKKVEVDGKTHVVR
jgi:hypothetical protein